MCSRIQFAIVSNRIQSYPTVSNRIQFSRVSNFLTPKSLQIGYSYPIVSNFIQSYPIRSNSLKIAYPIFSELAKTHENLIGAVSKKLDTSNFPRNRYLRQKNWILTLISRESARYAWKVRGRNRESARWAAKMRGRIRESP